MFTASAVTLRVQSLEKKIGTIASGERSALPCDSIRANLTALFPDVNVCSTESDAVLGWTVQQEGFYCLNIATNARFTQRPGCTNLTSPTDPT